MKAVEQLVQNLPNPVQHGLNWSAMGTAALSFLEIIKGPAAALASIASFIWLSLQIWIFLRNKPWKK